MQGPTKESLRAPLRILATHESGVPAESFLFLRGVERVTDSETLLGQAVRPTNLRSMRLSRLSFVVEGDSVRLSNQEAVLLGGVHQGGIPPCGDTPDMRYPRERKCGDDTHPQAKAVFLRR